MNENAKKWVEALESGRFEQGKQFLTRPGRYEENDKHCCLGVACVLYQEEIGDLHIERVSNDRIRYDGAVAILPPKVQIWLGLRDEQGSYFSSDSNLKGALTSDNDEGVTFAEIAATIRSEPEGLFA